MDAFAATLAAYRWYNSDGGEAASSPRAAQDTASDFDVTLGNVDAQLRVRIDETGAGSINGATTDDWQLEYRKNGAGAWSSLPASSGGVGVEATTAGLTNNAATTNRATNGISDGAGSFVAGEQSTDGLLDDHQLTADNFTEHVYGIRFVQADLLDTDSFEFRVALNGGSPGITISVTPSATITKSGTTHALTGSAAMRLDGTATGTRATPLTGTAALRLDATAVGTRVVFLTTQLTDP